MNTTIPTSNPQDVPPQANGNKTRAVFLSMAMIGAVLWPMQQNWRTEPKDSFPLSYYPMFSVKRTAVETFYYVVGRDAKGQRYHVDYRLIGDGGGNQVRRQLRKIVKDGRGEELASEVAKTLASQERKPWSKVVSVTVCTGKYSVSDFFHGNKEPISEKINGFAEVERRTNNETHQ